MQGNIRFNNHKKTQLHDQEQDNDVHELNSIQNNRTELKKTGKRTLLVLP